jgi:acyl carrier protein
MNTQLTQQVRDVIVKAFALSPQDAQGDLRMGSVPRWDSMGHMQLVSELESAFHVTFPAYALAELVDVDAIVLAIQEQQS